MKKNIVILIMTIIVICMGIFLYIDSKKDVISDNFTIEKNQEVKDKKEVSVEDSVNESFTDTKNNESRVAVKNENETSKKEEKIETKKEETTNVEVKEEKIVDRKEEVIYNEPVSYFLNESKVIETSNIDDASLKERAKNAFINIVDFIFYDKPINGYRFSQLTSEVKLKIIEIALNIDKKIDEKFPAYKEKIKEGVSNIKGKLGVKYLEVSAKICDNMGEYKCNLAKESFNNLKKSFSLTVELVKELAKSGSQKVKEIYEKFRG